MKRVAAFFCNASFLLVIALCVFTSCKKDTTASGKGNILFVQASPDAPSVDVRNVTLTGTAYSSENITGATGLAYSSGVSGLGYIGINPSTYYLGLYSAGASATIAPTLSLTGFVVPPDVNSSVFVVNRLASLSVSVVTDNLDAPAPGKAKIRFFHLSPDGPALNLYTASNAVSPAPASIPASATPVFSNRIFNDQNGVVANANFISVPTGYYRIEIRNAGGTAITALTVPSLLLDDGRIYTIYVRGLVTPPTGNTNTLSTKVLINY